MASSATKSKDIQVIEIDLGKYGGPIFIGRSEGAEMRQRFRLDDYDHGQVQVNVRFPETTKGVGSSFFLAMFGDSIRKAGSKARFTANYKFYGPDYLIEDLIKSNIERALFEGDLFNTLSSN